MLFKLNLNLQIEKFEQFSSDRIHIQSFVYYIFGFFQFSA